MTRSLPFALAALPLLVVACGGEPPATPPTPAPSAAPSTEPPAADTTPVASASPDATPPAPTAPTPAVKYAGLDTPESVYYDDANDRYLVSNINGKPLDVDDNGYIAILSPDGTITTQKWISGGQNNVKLDAPKGMAIAKGILYVADITVVRMFDAKTGVSKGEVKIPGSTFLNDVAASADGSKIYVSDSALKATDKGFGPTGTDAVWIIEKKKAKVLAKSPDLGAPNGLLPVATGVWVVTFGSGELYRLDVKGAKQDATKLPKGTLDGIVALGDSLLISSWEGSEIFRGKPGGTFDVALPGQKAPADIGYDTKRGRVLVPHFMDGTVEAYDLK
jgi:sugar lactone lactonase YvrE